MTETHRGLRQKSFKRPLDDVAWRRKAAAVQPAAGGVWRGRGGNTSMLPGMARQLGSRSPHKIRKFDVVQQAKLKWRRGRQRDDEDDDDDEEAGRNAITNACCKAWHGGGRRRRLCGCNAAGTLDVRRCSH